MKRTGIWIDLKEANIINLTDDKETLINIPSEVITRRRIPGEGKKYSRFGDQYLDDEKGKKNRIEKQTKRFLQKVIKHLETSDEFFIFGPAQVKIKLDKLIHKYPRLLVKLREVINADQMTENQKIAFVRDYYKNLED